MKSVFMFFVVLLICLLFFPVVFIYTVLDSIVITIAEWCMFIDNNMREYVFKSKEEI